MLRSSNVRSLWTGTRAGAGVGIGRCVAMSRFSSRTCCAGALQHGLPVQAGRPMVGSRVRQGLVPRWYTTEERPAAPAESTLEFESGMPPEENPRANSNSNPDADADERADPDEKPTPEELHSETEPEPEPEDTGPPTALDIAKAGTSSKENKIEYGTTRGLLTNDQLHRELRWLADPRALADRVARLLAEKDLASAAAMTRMAQARGVPCTVAWNHLMDYCMKQGEPLAAFRFYNDMKKRRRKPNSWTYTIMLKGFSRVDRLQARDVKPVALALSIYRSIFAPNSPVKPNVIHTNAMLDVCARQGDMNQMWRIVGEMPEKGPTAPDPYTYTIILKGIVSKSRRDVERLEYKEQPRERILKRRADAIIEAKSVWADIIHQWTHGRLALDNSLVRMFAEVLLEGSTNMDCYDVLAAYHQVAGIPIIPGKPRVHAPKPKGPQGTNKEKEDVPFVDAAGREIEVKEEPERSAEEMEMKEETEEQDGEMEMKKEEQEDDEGWQDELDFEKLFDPVVTETSNVKHIPITNRELTTILDACMTMSQGIGSGKTYWQYLTSPANRRVQPDKVSCHQYLRLLRISRSSRAVVEVIRDFMLPAGIAQRKTFTIAFSCLLRDRKNSGVVQHANKLLEMMDRSLLLPDLRALTSYHSLIHILCDNPQLLLSMSDIITTDATAKQNQKHKGIVAQGQELIFQLKVNAATNLRPHITKLNVAMDGGAIPNDRGPARGRLALLAKEHGQPGDEVKKVLVRTRLMIDEILHAPQARSLGKTERKLLKADSDALKKYSDAKLDEKYRKMIIVPTNEQIEAFREREQPE